MPIETETARAAMTFRSNNQIALFSPNRFTRRHEKAGGRRLRLRCGGAPVGHADDERVLTGPCELFGKPQQLPLRLVIQFVKDADELFTPLGLSR